MCQREKILPIPVWCKWIQPTIGWGWLGYGMSTGFSVLFHKFAWKQCIICSALHHKCNLTLLHVTSIRDSFCLGTFANGFIRLPPCLRGCSLAIIKVYLDFLNLLVQSPNVSIWFLRSLFKFHNSHHGIRVIRQDTNYCMHLTTQNNNFILT